MDALELLPLRGYLGQVEPAGTAGSRKKGGDMRLIPRAVAMFAAANAFWPAAANQWVAGNVTALADFGSYNSGQSGVRITLVNKTWGGGDTSNGPTACTGDFRVVVGTQGMTEETKNRVWSAVLTGYSIGHNVMFYVDTVTSAPDCAVQIVRMGDGAVP